MNIDGSFRIATLNAVKDLEWGVAELPTNKGIKSNFASFWTHSIVTGVSGKKLEASVKFLKYITSPEVQELWLQKVGELPATPSLSENYKNDPVISVFLKGLAYAHATVLRGRGRAADHHGERGGRGEPQEERSRRGAQGRGRGRADAHRRFLEVMNR